MTYIPGNPVIGFTLELDGPPDVIERVGRKAMRAVQDEFDQAMRAQQTVWSGLPERASYIIPVSPLRGVLHVRTTE